MKTPGTFNKLDDTQGTEGAPQPLGAHLDDGRDELHQEARHLEQAGVEVVQEVHDEPLDVRPVVVLVRHDHQVPVPQLPSVRVVLRGGQVQASGSRALGRL